MSCRRLPGAVRRTLRPGINGGRELIKPPLPAAQIRTYDTRPPPDDLPDTDTDFLLSILRSSPSMRDSRSYLASFAPPSPSTSEPPPPSTRQTQLPPFTVLPEPVVPSPTPAAPSQNSLVASLLNSRPRRPALVKIQGPFTDAQLLSISRGMSHLQKLGLVSVIVMDRDDLPAHEPRNDAGAASRQREIVMRDVERLVQSFSRWGSTARPIFATVARLREETGSVNEGEEGEVVVEEEGLDHIYRAVSEGEIPVLLPVALDAGCRSRRVSSNLVLLALAKAMSTPSLYPSASSSSSTSKPLDLTPMRLLVINREGGIPSYARNGMPHLSINLASEYDYIRDTFMPHWRDSHPTALENLTLANDCLARLPAEASALIVSHRSPAALIANLITNKPAHSASLPHSLLSQSEGRITRDTPTIIRKGLPVRVLRSMSEIDKPKMKRLLEGSFRRVLDEERFWTRLERDLDFVIVVGDYAGAAICTLEGRDHHGMESDPICYLDKFAVHPSHQGDGTVDFLWVALRDETYGLGLLDAANPSIGSLSGQGRGRDLVWRSRADNPVNKWYFERSSGFCRLGGPEGKWKMFWCDAEERLRLLAKEEGREFAGGRLLKVIEDKEMGRLARWEPVVADITSAWK